MLTLLMGRGDDGKSRDEEVGIVKKMTSNGMYKKEIKGKREIRKRTNLPQLLNEGEEVGKM